VYTSVTEPPVPSLISTQKNKENTPKTSGQQTYTPHI